MGHQHKQIKRPVDIFKYSRVIIILLPLVVYFATIKLGFVYFDDDVLILENFAKLSNISNIGLAFRTDAFFSTLSPYYRPLMNVSYMMDAIWGSSSAGVFHFWNLIYHILTCLSLFYLLPQLGFNKSQTLIATLIFSVHPTLGHAVLWIPARGDILVTLFAILSFALLLQYLKAHKILHLFLHVICFAAALFSKESGILLPLFFFIYLLIKREPIFKKKTILMYLGWVLIILLWYFLRNITIDHRPDSQRGVHALLQNFQFLPEAFTRLIFPLFLPVLPVFSTSVTASGIIITILIIYAIFWSKDRTKFSIALFGLAWLIGFCLPNMYVRLTSASDSFEYLLHRLYLPSVGLTITLLAIIPSSLVDLLKTKTRITVIAILVLFSGYAQYQQIQYKNAVNFWNSAIDYRPDKAWYYFPYGRYYFKIKDLDTYEKLLLKAISIRPYSAFLYQIGMIYFIDRKDYVKAYNYFNAAFERGHNEPEIFENYVKLCLESSYNYFKRNELDSAIERCNEVFKYEPRNGVAAYNLGIYLVNKGEKQQAAAMWYTAIKFQPELKDAYRSLSLYYQHDVIIPDSAAYFADQYLKRGGTNSPLPANKR